MVLQLSLFSHGSVGGFWLVTVGLNYLSSSGMVAGLTLLQPTGGGLKSVLGSALPLYAPLVFCRYCLIFNDT